ncbi:MAG: hypothetical protein JXA20_05195 [Spirochaetes bacterium]|nr:hypothetical protein [Spirochaetota bacterium]
MIQREVYYLFRGDEYVKHKWDEAPMAGYPRGIAGNWKGWPAGWGAGGVDAVVYDPVRKVYYLFKGSEYVKHKWDEAPMAGYPRGIAGNWKGWPE